MRNDSDCFLDKSTSHFNVYSASAPSQQDTFVVSGAYAIFSGFYNTRGPRQAEFLTWTRLNAYIQNPRRTYSVQNGTSAKVFILRTFSFGANEGCR